MRKLLPQISLITILILAIGFFVMPHMANAAEPGLFECGADITCWLFGSANALYGWLAKIFWWGLIPLAGIVFSTIGLAVDEALRLSLDGTFYNAEAIGIAWSVIRDIANMLFIFILIYEGIRTILNLGNLVTVRKTITSVIIAALFLNFSLFFTKVVIDVSNIAATWFMQGITNIGQNPSVSLSIGSTLNMNKLASKYSGDTQKDLEKIGLQSFATGAILFVLMCVAIYVFFNFLFLVIGRIVAFIFLLITAPIGFVGALVPMLQEYSKKWWKELNDQAMMLPMFFLMVYLTLFIVDRIQNLLLASSVDPDAFTTVNYVIFIIIIMMLLKALKVAKEYSGEMGNMIGGLTKSAATFVGGAALIGTVGRAASAIKSSEGLQKLASSRTFGGIAARGILAGSNATANASFGTKSAYGATLKATGMDKTSLKDQFKGTDKGYAGKVEQEIKDEEAFAKLLGKGTTGARNRETYAATLQNSLWSRSMGRIYGSRAGDAGAAEKIKKSAGNELKKEDAKKAKEKKAKIKEEMKKDKAEMADIERQIAEATKSMGPESDKTKLEAIENNIKALKQKLQEKQKEVKQKEDSEKEFDEEIEAGREVEQAERDEKLGALDKKLDKSGGSDKPKEEKKEEPPKE